MSSMDALREWIERRLFAVESDRWITVLRLGLGFLVVIYALSMLNDWNYLFGTGLVTHDVAEGLLSLQSPFIPRLGWAIALGTRVGLSEEAVLSAVWIGLVCAGCSLLLGFACRLFAILAWFLHLCTAKSGEFVSYGVDNFMTIGLFYLMLSRLPDRMSFDGWRREGLLGTSLLSGFFRRVLQLHLCIIYFFSGLTKCLGGGWWDGSNIWRALTRPPFNIIPPEILVRWKYALPILGILICIVEIGYPFFIWVRGTRLLWLGAVIAMHLAIGVAMGMYLFALVMIVLNVAAFGPGVLDFRHTSDPAIPVMQKQLSQ